MTDQNRRAFLRQSTTLAASGVLTACGAGEADFGDSATSATRLSAGGTVPLSAGTAVIGPTGTPIENARFMLKSTAAQSGAPYCLGYAFRRGDVPAGSTVAADRGIMQVSVKNTWPDGSLKFAVLAGLTDLAANTRTTVSLRVVPAKAAQPGLTTARLRDSGAVASVDCGAYGTVTWQAKDWETPFQSWVSGPYMSSWIYRKPVGADAHLVAWLEVRVFTNGAVEMLPWIENGYLKVAAPTNKSATYRFTLGGKQRMSAAIDLKHHQRTPLISGAALSYWLGTDPDITIKHDTAYLQSTELVPAYYSTVASTAFVATRLATTFQPLQVGNIIYDSDSMASSGYQDPIGLLPQHDVLYLTCDADVTYGAVVRNGFSAGRYGIHYRDESTQRPARFSSHPNLNIGDNQGFKDTGGSTRSQYTPKPTGGNPPGWDVAHSPSVGFTAYLVTGRWYFMEEVQFATTANYLGNGDNSALRNGSQGLVRPCPGAWQTRSCAWDWRARVQALCVTPDSDTALRAEFIASVEANIEHFHNRYIATTNNPYGWVQPGEDYNGVMRNGSPWQQDFVTAAFGYSVSMGLPISSTAAAKLSAFFQWKARSAVMRLGTQNTFWYINAVPYNVMISSAANPDYTGGTGPWYASDAEVYAATYAVAPTWLGKTEGTLAAEYMPGDNAMWGNLMPAIAYAVRHNVPGAQAAYARLTGASNWKTLRDAFNLRPVWGVKPATGAASSQSGASAGTPAWLVGAAVGQWVEIPGTSGAGGAAVDAYSGFAYNHTTNEILIAAAGGHHDSADNRVVSLRLTSDAPTWTLRTPASSQPQIDVAYYPDGKPAARHLYSSLQYVPQVNRLMLFGVRYAYGNGYSFAKVDGFNLDTNTWDPAGTWLDAPTGHSGAVCLRATGDVWTTGLSRWSPATKTWSQPITSRTGDLMRTPIAHDTLRNQLVTLNWRDGEGYSAASLFASKVPLDGNRQISVTFNPSAALNSLIADAPTYSAMDYDAANDRMLFYCGQGGGAGRVYVIKPNSTNTWDVSILPLTGAVRPPATPGAGVHNRFRYIPTLGGFVLMPFGKSNLYFLRTT